MAVTLRGTFAIIDLASGKIRRIRNEALEADAAVAGLGQTLDGVGSPKQAKALESYSRQQRVAGNEMEASTRRSNALSKAMGRQEHDTNRLSRAWRGLLQSFLALRVLALPAKILAIGAAVGVAAQAIGALAGGVVGLLPALSDLAGFAAVAPAGILGIASAAIAGKLALGGLSQAMGGNKQALKELTPEARKFLAVLRAYKPTMKGIKEEAQRGLFPGLTAALARASRGAPTLGRIVNRGGKALGGAALDTANRLTAPAVLGDIEGLAGQGDVMLRRLVRSMLNLLGVAINFGSSAKPFTEWLSRGLELWTKNRLAISQFNRDSGKTAAFLERSRESWTRFVSITTHLWRTFRGLGQASRALGDDLWDSADRAAKRWDKFVNSVAGQEKLMRDFDNMADNLHAIFRLVGAVGGALFRMGTQPGVEKVADGLTGLVPALEKILNGLSNTFGPPMVELLMDFGNVLTDVGGLSGPFVLMLKLLDGILKTVDGIARAVPPVGKALQIGLSVFLIQRFLVKLGLLRAGWFGVAGAANAAAAAEARAASVGMLGGIRGRLGSRIGGSTFGTAFGLSRMGAAERGGGLMGRSGTILGGASRALGRTGRVGGPALFAGGLAASFLPGRAGTIGAAAATGAGLGMLLGPEGALAGGLIGAGVGAFQSRRSGGDLKLEATNKALKMGLATVASYPVALGRLQAEINLYQSAAKNLADDHSREAKAELEQLREEVSVRERLIDRIKAEEAQKKRAESIGRGRGIATELDKAMTFLRRHGRTRAQALGESADIGIGALSTLKGPGRLNLARAILSKAAGEAKLHPDERAEAARIRAAVLAVVPNAASLTAPDRRFKGTLKEEKGLRKLFTVSELVREQGQRKLTAAQRAYVNWMVAAGWTREEAVATVMRDERAHRTPTLIGKAAGMRGNALAPKPSQSAGFNDWLKGTPLGQFLAGVGAAGSKVPVFKFGPNGELLVRFEAPPAPAAASPFGGAPAGAAPKNKTTPGSFGVLPRNEQKRRILSGVTNGRMTPDEGRSAWRFWKLGPVPFARGGRVAGLSMHDNYEIAPGQFAAGGELVVNRHTEADVNRMLGGRTTLGGMVAGETRPHYMARGGRLHEGIASITELVRAHDPALAVTSTTSGNHAKNSYHYKGMAVDLAGAGMDEAGSWIASHLTAKLLEGIHNPTLSVKNGRAVSPSFWGASTWAGHADHIHLAASGGAVDAGGAGKKAGAGARPSGAAAAAVSFGPVGIAATRRSLLNSIIGLPVIVPGAGAGAAAAPARRTSSTTTSSEMPGGLPTGTSGSNQQLGRRMMLARGWPAAEWPSLRELWTGESGWRTDAENASSGAYGIPQSLPGSKMAAAGADWQTNPETQIRWGLGYIGGRYGSPSAALEAWQGRSPHWYARGGRLMDSPTWAGWHAKGGSFLTDGPTMFGAGEGGKRERVTIAPAGARAGMTFAPHVPITVHASGGDPDEVRRAVEEGVERALNKAADELERVGISEEAV